MSVIEHIKEMISPGASENAQAWAARYFAGPEENVASGVVQLIVATAGVEPDRLTAETRLIEDLALNELQRVQLVLAVEQQFTVEISDEDAAGVQTIGHLIACVHSKSPTTENSNATEQKQ